MLNMNKNMLILKTYLKDYVSQFKTSSFYFDNGLEIFKSGTDSYTLNFVFVEPDFLNVKLEDVNLNSIIISNSNAIENKIEKSFNNVKFLTKLKLMYKNQQPIFYSAKFYDDITIKRITNNTFKQDFFMLFSKAKNVDIEFLNQNMFINGIPNNHHIFLSYFNEKPVGFFYAISSLSGFFIVDVFIEENYRKMGILNALASKAKEFVIDNEIEDLYAMPSSDFSIKVMNNESFEFLDYINVWITSKA